MSGARDRANSADIPGTAGDDPQQKCATHDAVGTLISERPPHRSVRAAFPHTALTSGDGRQIAGWAKDGGCAVLGASRRPTSSSEPR